MSIDTTPGPAASGASSSDDSTVALRVIRGNPSPEELAALTAVVLALGEGTTAEGRRQASRVETLRRRARHTRRLMAMPGSWRSGRF